MRSFGECVAAYLKEKRTKNMNPNEFQAAHIEEALKARPHLQMLIDKLLSLGDGVPVIWHEEFVTNEGFVRLLLLAGRVSNGKCARLRLMEPCACHSNSERLAIKYPHIYQREIGFALSDRTWGPHSWGFDRRKNQIVETTVMRKLYFGVTMAISDREKREYMQQEVTTCEATTAPESTCVLAETT
jgi:hypothetical protein